MNLNLILKMKKQWIVVLLFLSTFCGYTQDKKYVDLMSLKIKQIEQTNTKDSLQWLANDFIRIGEKEKDEWLPYYYAALVVLKQVRLSPNDSQKADDFLDVADNYIKIAEERKKHVELDVLKYMYHSSRMQINPKARYAINGVEAERYLQSILREDPENPRGNLMKALALFYTPKTFGGNPQKAKTLLEQIKLNFHNYRIESSISPNWGLAEIAFFLKEF